MIPRQSIEFRNCNELDITKKVIKNQNDPTFRRKLKPVRLLMTSIRSSPLEEPLLAQIGTLRSNTDPGFS